MSESSFSIEGAANKAESSAATYTFGYKMEVPRTHENPEEGQLAELKKELQGWGVRLKPYKGKPITYAYWEPAKGVRSREATIQGPWGDVALHLTVDGSDIGKGGPVQSGHFTIPSGRPPLAGFTFGPSASSGKIPGKLTLTIK